MGSNACSSIIEKTADEQAIAEVVRVLNAYVYLPLHALATGRSQSVPSLLCQVTGLSKARISKGNLDSLRPSTLSRIHVHQQNWLAEQVSDQAALARVNERIASAPRTESGLHASWATWIHVLEVLPEIPLPISKKVGLTVDELVERVMAACREVDLLKFKKILLEHIEQHGVAVPYGDDPVAETAFASELADLQASKDWVAAARFSRKLFEHLYIDLICALDAEWSSNYFSGRQRHPLFPLVMVRLQDGLLERRTVSSRKNIIFKPVRRLLEFLYALAFYIRYRRWPAKPPSPKTLAGILYRPGAEELLESSVVSSYFDGSTTLTLDLVYDHWIQLSEHFKLERSDGRRVMPPLPMIMLALQWQTLLIQDKGRTFILLDLENYNFLWRHRRKQWDAIRAAGPHKVPAASRGTGEPIDWPDWMLGQSSSSSLSS